MSPREGLREYLEVFALTEDTLDILAARTSYSREELIGKLEEARGSNQWIMFALFRLEKLN